MGTRRSKHNKGRRPQYKDHFGARPLRCDFCSGIFYTTTRHFAARDNGIINQCEECRKKPNSKLGKRYQKFPLQTEPYEWTSSAVFQGTTWTPEEKSFLEIYWRAGANKHWLADHLLRTPSTVVHAAMGSCFARPLWMRRRPREPLLSYPYIRVSKSDEERLILAVNDSVPRGLPENMRADMCQEAILAIYDGTVTLKEIKSAKGMTWFVRKFYRSNFEPHGTKSLDQLQDDKDRNWQYLLNNYSTLQEDRVDGQTDWVRTFEPADQIETIYQEEIQEFASRRQWTFSEAKEFLD